MIDILPWAVLATALLGLFVAATKPNFAALLVVEAFKIVLPTLLKPASEAELKRMDAGPGRSHNNTAAGQSGRKFNREKGA